MSDYPQAVLVAVEAAARRLARLGGDGLAGILGDEELRDLAADTARTLAGVIEDSYREIYPPEEVPPEGVGITASSPAAEVVAWVEAHGLAASAKVVRSWVWLEGQSAVPDRLELVVRAAGFRFSPKRRAWFHTGGVESAAKTGRAKSLSACHGVSTVETFKAGKHSADPAWLVTKQAKAKRRAALKSGSPAPAWGS